MSISETSEISIGIGVSISEISISEIGISIGICISKISISISEISINIGIGISEISISISISENQSKSIIPARPYARTQRLLPRATIQSSRSQKIEQ